MKRAKASSIGHGLVALHIATKKPNPSPAKVIQVVQEGLDFAELESLREQLDLAARSPRRPARPRPRHPASAQSERSPNERRIGQGASFRPASRPGGPAFRRDRGSAAVAEGAATRPRRRRPARLCADRNRRARSGKSPRPNRLRRLFLMPSGWRIVRQISDCLTQRAQRSRSIPLLALVSLVDFVRGIETLRSPHALRLADR